MLTPSRAIPLLLLAAVLASCGGKDEAANGSAGGGNASGGRGGRGGRNQGPTQVGFVVVKQADAPLVSELSGRTAAFETSDVRPQVAGVIRQRFFTEGSLVRAGQTLYQIDPSIYRAAANQAQANLAAASATAEAARIKADRYKPLAEAQAVSQQDYTDANATANQTAAQVAQNRAQLETARINLRFTNVPAPISGRIGRSLYTVGALVTTNQTDPLAQIQRLDPMFVDIQQSSADLLALRRALSTGGVAPGRATVHLKLEDGSEYGNAGTVEFAEAMVEATTGTVTLRARFPNPQGLLLPGMFVRAQFVQAIDRNAILVPQQAVSRDPKGEATVYVVGPGNKALQRKVKADRTSGESWVVTAGLNDGDKVIVQGTGQLTPNKAIRPVPADTPQRIGPAGGRNGKGAAAGQARGG